MRKAIRALTITAIILMILTTLAFVAAVVLQNVLAPLLGLQEAAVFVVPIGRTVYVAGLLLCVILLTSTAGSHTIGIWAEVAVAILIGMVLPLAQSILIGAQNMMLGMKGVEQIMSYNVANTLSSYATVLAPVVTTLALLACGMSITYKRMIKKLH